MPLDWAFSHHTLANAEAAIAERRGDPALMRHAIGHMRDAAEVYREGGVTHWLPEAEQRIAAMEATLLGMP